ncbi:MAG: FMN-binding protein [Clostridia bacterium]|nr:FMN-binding protein [Clostridia bacterium]
MSEKNAKKPLLPAFAILAIIAVVAALILGFTNKVTEEPIAKYKANQLKEAFSAVMPTQQENQAFNFEAGAISDAAQKAGVTDFAVVTDQDGKQIGYSVKASSKGYAGPVAVILGLNGEGTVIGAQIGDSDFGETDGFGKRWLEEGNVASLLGLNAQEGGSFDALSGATLTSNAVRNATNAALSFVALEKFGKDWGEEAPTAAGAPAGVSYQTIQKSGTATALLDKQYYTAPASGTDDAGSADIRVGKAVGFGGGEVTVTLAVDPDTSEIRNLQLDVSTQTDGYGQRCGTDEAFLAQFAGKTVPLESIDALSGATVTSNAIMEAINAAESVIETRTGTAEGFGGGAVTVDVQVNSLDETIVGLTVDVSTQTDGYGQRCGTDEAFLAQFAGKTLPLESIDALSGATVTSNAIMEAINSTLATTEKLAESDAAVILRNKEDGSLIVQPAEGFEGKVTVVYEVAGGQIQGTEVTSLAAGAEAAEKSGNAALTATKPGYNDADVTVSLELDGNGAITAITVDATSQTPSIGQRCMEEAFTSQFIGKSGKVMLDAGIDAVSGATVTSTAVVRAVNEILKNAAAAPAEEKKEPAAPALTATKPGYNDADVTVSLELDGNGAITAITVDATSQTPGIGQRCMEEAFTNQFIGKSGKVMLDADIDAVTGATVTSTAVVRAVNEILKNAAAPAEEKKEPEQPAEAASLTATKPGYNDADVTVSLELDGNGAITAITVDATSQTPGIGQRCMEEAFTSQFIGRSGKVMLDADIDAVTGATVTSTAVVRAVNEILKNAAAAPAQPEETAKPAEEAKEPEEVYVYQAIEGGITASNTGFSGKDVTVSLKLNDEGTAIAEIAVDAGNESSPAGRRCASPEFTDQFIGKGSLLTLGEEIEAVSGATITGSVVVRTVNEILAREIPQPEVKAEAAEPAERPEIQPAQPLPVREPQPVRTYTEEVTLTGKDVGFTGNDITVTLTVDTDGSIKAITVDAGNETRDLGRKCMEAAFTDQFVGKSAPVVLGEDVDAVTGATITSAAVVGIVNDMLDRWPPKPGEEEQPAEAAAPEAEGFITATATGFSGKDITVRVKLNEEGTAIAEIAVDAAGESADYGRKCGEAAFTDQFVGKGTVLTLGEDIEAVSGATITGAAVVRAVNEIIAAEIPQPVPQAAAEPAERPEIQPAQPLPVREPQPARTHDTVVTMTGRDAGFTGKDIIVTLTVNTDGSIGGMTVDASGESEDLGRRCAETAFTDQFIGKGAPVVLGEDVDAVTGATITSAAVVGIVNDLLNSWPPEAQTEENSAPQDDEGLLTASNKGFSGQDVTVSLKLNEEGTAIAEIAVDAANESEGYGRKCGEAAFTDQFIGKGAVLTIGEDIEAVSGATITSTVVVQTVNEILLKAIPQPAAATVEAAEPAERPEIKPAEPIAKPEPKPAQTYPTDVRVTGKGAGFVAGKDITVILVIDTNGAVKAITVDVAGETEDRGRKCEEEAFTAQFIGKSAPIILGEDVDAVSGATITSAAVVRIVNELLNGWPPAADAAQTAEAAE